MKYFFSLLCCWGWALGVWAADAQQLFQEGNNAYQSNSYIVAIQKYEDILRGGQASAETYHNLGNAYAKQGQIGWAVLNFERGLRLRSNDPQILKSLQFVRRQIVEDVPQVETFFLLRWWRALGSALSATVWSIFGLILAWISAASLVLWLISSERRLKIRGFSVGLALAPLAALLLGLGWQQMTVETAQRHAIIIAKEIKLRTSPDENAPELRNLHEGIKIEILEKNNLFIKIRLPNAEEGWIDGRGLSAI
jgi:tetratricopeptide (TPR) repeat protein